MAEIIDDNEIKAVESLTEKFNKLGSVLDDIIVKGKENQTVIEQSKAVGELTRKIGELEKNQQKLVEENKKLKDAQEKATKATKDQEEAMDALDDNMGGVISKAKEMGKQFLALMRNPFILALATIVGTIAAMASAMKTFLTNTGEGEDILNRQKGVWNQFFNVLKAGWKDLGKSFVEALGEDGLQGLLYGILSYFSPALAASFMKTSGEAKELADVIDDIETRMAINITRRADAELKYNRLSLQAEKLKYEDQVKAVALLEEGIKVKEQQMLIDKQLAKQQADATLYQIGLEHNLTKAEVDRMSHEERDAEFTGEEMKKIAEAYANVINLEAAYEQEVRRNTTKIVAFKEQIRKSIVDSATHESEAAIQLAVDSTNRRVALLQEEAAARVAAGENRFKVIKDTEEKIEQVRKDAVQQHIQNQINEYSKLLGLAQLNAEERYAIEQKLNALEFQLSDEMFNKLKQGYQITFEDIVTMYQDFTSSLNDLFQSITENRLAQIDAEEKAMEERYAREIELAGDNEETKAILEREAEKRREILERKRITEQRKAAIFDKAVSATQASIQTSLAIIRMLANPGGPAGVAMSIAAGITGALQVAAILAKPIPQYKDGGKTIADIIIAGEEGFEMYRTPSGEVGLTPDTATVMRLPVGTEITPHDETVRQLAADAIDNVGGRLPDDNSWMLYHKLDSLENTIKNKKEVHMNWTRKGLERAIKNGESRTYFMNEFYK